MTQPLLQTIDLHKSYSDGSKPTVDILKGVHFSMAKGESAAIVGASGAGKSTFLHVLGGLDHADSGKILIEGQDLSSMPNDQVSAFRNRSLGFVFQFHHLLHDFSALENVMMPQRINRIPIKQAKEQAAYWLKEVGLEHRVEHRPSQLSGGEQQRVALARALVNQPKLLLADEPTGNLDHDTGEAMLDLMMRVNQSHQITLLLITHNPEIADALDKKYVMKEGQLILESQTS